MSISKKYLYNISLMRCLLIIGIIVHHSFMPFTGDPSWQSLSSDTYIIYKYISWLAVTLSLGTFVFISGNLWNQHIQEHGIINQILYVCKIKGKRLIYPAFVWGLVVYIMFHPKRGVGDFVFFVANGGAHLWFLIMLFWCFLLDVVLNKVFFNNIVLKYIILVSVSIFFNMVQLPFQISSALFYLTIFEFGKDFHLFQERIICINGGAIY